MPDPQTYGQFETEEDFLAAESAAESKEMLEAAKRILAGCESAEYLMSDARMLARAMPSLIAAARERERMQKFVERAQDGPAAKDFGDDSESARNIAAEARELLALTKEGE